MSLSPTCAVIGYASLDNKFSTGPFAGVSRTTTINNRLAPGPEAGGAAYFARAVHRQGLACQIITWVGADAGGQAFVADLDRFGVDTSAVSQVGSRSPTSYIFYGDDGEAIGYFDPGELSQVATDRQREAVRRADSVVIGIGPREATGDLLSCVSVDAHLSWAVKADPASLDPMLAQALADRADLVCMNRHETSYMQSHCGIDLTALSRRGCVVVTTSGSQAPTCLVEGEEHDLPAPAYVDVLDPTGAGDTFASSLAARLARVDRPTFKLVREAAGRAAHDVEEMLRSRTSRP